MRMQNKVNFEKQIKVIKNIRETAVLLRFR